MRDMNLAESQALEVAQDLVSDRFDADSRVAEDSLQSGGDLVAILSRDAKDLQGRILAGLVKKGLIELRFLDVPNRPDQTYRTVLKLPSKE